MFLCFNVFMNFTHLHTHSHYSLLDGLAKPEELLQKTKEQGLSALALTDHGVMYGAIEFYQKAIELGIKPIIGIETYVAPNGMLMKQSKTDAKPYHLVLLAKNKEGYRNLIKLVTRAHLEGFYYKPRVDLDLLKKHHEGLVALSACLEGEIPREIVSKNLDFAAKKALEYQKIFGKGNFYLELQHHPSIEKQAIVNDGLIKISKKYNIPLVATNDTHYLNSEDDKIQDILLCIQTQRKVADQDRLSMLGDDFSLKSPKEMEKAFHDVPQALENTVKIAESCNLKLELGKTKLPEFKVPEGFNVNSYLRKLCLDGLKRKYPSINFQFLISNFQSNPKSKISNPNNSVYEKTITNRLSYELSVIEKTGFAAYLLIVSDFVNWAKNNKIVVGPGRGSAAGSLVSYLLNITEIDPIKYDLLFERFLNPERISMPDIDLDFADDRRDEVIEYVKKKYGENRVAQIITFGTMAARAAVRDCGRVLSLPYDFCDRVAKLIPMMMSLSEALKKSFELKELYDSDPEAKKLIDYAKKLEGVARHASTHACGVVITPDDISNHIPRQHASQNDQTVVTQYGMHAVEDSGLLKMDFLGLKNLTIIQNAIRIIRKTCEINLDIQKIPLDDLKTFKLLKQGCTTGVFQLESSGMKRYLKQLLPSELENIIAMVALYRPGPMEWIPDYIAGKQGRKKISYIHPKVKPILEKTYGVAIYQEQVMQVARDLAGFTLAEADVLRKAVGKKIRSLLLEQHKKFIQGCIANNISKDIAEKVFSFIEPFAGYGFNRSHAACYALIAYQTAYLKTRFPHEFMAALLTSDQGDTDRVAIEISECEQMRIKVLPPDINESFANFTVVVPHQKEKWIRQAHHKCIRFGLTAIKNVGENIVCEIIEERKRNGKFQNLDDLLKRVTSKDLNKKSLESLAKSGALDRFGERNQILYNVPKILNYAKTVQKAKLRGQTDLFEFGNQSTTLPQLKLAKTPPAEKKERLTWEKELLGLYVSEHPLDEFKDYLRANVTPCANINKEPEKQYVTIGGIVSSIKKIITRTSEPMLFVKLEDITSNIEILVFPSVLKKNPTVWQEDKIIIVAGRISDKDGEIKLLAEEAKEIKSDEIQQWERTKQESKNLDNLNSNFLEIIIPQNASPDLFQELKNILKSSSGKQDVILKIPSGYGNFKEIKTNFAVDYDNLKQKLGLLSSQKGIKVLTK
jgi:DNA polymerase-3 subunit alpha